MKHSASRADPLEECELKRRTGTPILVAAVGPTRGGEEHGKSQRTLWSRKARTRFRRGLALRLVAAGRRSRQRGAVGVERRVRAGGDGERRRRAGAYRPAPKRER